VIATVNWQAWNNTAFGPAAAAVLTTVACVNATGTAAASGNYTSVAVVGNIISPITDLMVFTVVTDGAVRLWVDDNLLVDNSTVDVAPPRGLVAIAGVPFTAGVPRTLRLEYSHWTASSPALALWWQGNVTAAAVVPPDAYTATITSAQIERAAVRDRLYAPAVAWGTYNNPSMGDHVQLPSGAAFTTTLVDTATNDTLGDILVYRDAQPAITTVGPHSYNGSDATSLRLDRWGGRACTIVLATTTSADGADLYYTAAANGTDCATLALVVGPTVLFGHAGGAVRVAPGVLRIDMPGFPSVVGYSTTGDDGVPFPNASLPVYWALPLAAGTVGFSTGANVSVTHMSAAIAAALASQTASYSRFGDLADVYEAMQSVLAWNTAYTPYEGVITPVSRGWDYGSGYVLFHWDTELAAWMLGMEDASRDLAFNNIMQIVLAATLEGMIPNYASGVDKSYDRTEPQLGAQVVVRLRDRWHADWLYELLFDPLMGAHNWTWAMRMGGGDLAPGATLFVVGTNPTAPPGDWATNTMQGARYESGMDDSPMYDGVDNGLGPVTFDNVTTHTMQLYDVGMTSYFMAEASALMTMAAALGRTAEYALLRQRLDVVAASVEAALWDNNTGMYANRLFNGTFYPRISPTSFFPMLSGLPSRDRVLSHLLPLLRSPEGFCVTGDHTGPPNSTMLIQYYDGVHDYDACATDACITAAVLDVYEFTRVEALVPTTPPAGEPVAPLYHYYSAANDDNLVTTASTPPAGYAFVRQEGYSFTQPGPNRVPLTLWWSAGMADFKVCGDAPACLNTTAGVNGSAPYTYVTQLGWAYNATGLDNLPCAYALPSIARSDPAFFDNGYWRGRIWGPHYALLYWALSAYDDLPQAHDARDELVRHGTALLRNNWALFRHVNENSNGACVSWGLGG